MKKHLKLGTRGSALALAQVELVRQALQEVHPQLQVEQRIMETSGDTARAPEDKWQGLKGMFTREIEQALLREEIDIAVHSLKDLPGRVQPGLVIGAVLERAPVEDVLVTRQPVELEALSSSDRIGTSSIRRRRQLEWLVPGIETVPWRGNVPTRLRKLLQDEAVTGIVLAQAGLQRLGFVTSGRTFLFEEKTLHLLSLAGQLLPAAGQGIIAIQCRDHDHDVLDAVRAVNHHDTWVCMRAERELLRLLDGDCELPVGVRTQLRGAWLTLEAAVFDAEGAPRVALAEGAAAAPEELATTLFNNLYEE